LGERSGHANSWWAPLLAGAFTLSLILIISRLATRKIVESHARREREVTFDEEICGRRHARRHTVAFMRTIAAGALLAVLATGCGTTATIHQRSGAVTEARIIGGTREYVYVRTLAGRDQIARKDITNINHPGDVSATVGGVVTTLAGTQLLVQSLLIGLSVVDFGTGTNVGLIAQSILTTGVGVGMTVEGMQRYNRSVDAAAPHEQDGAGPSAVHRGGVPLFVF
jgi:hypothetical protein